VRIPTGGEAAFLPTSPRALKIGRTGQNPVPTVFAEFPHLVRMAKLRKEICAPYKKLCGAFLFAIFAFLLRNCSYYLKKEGVLL